MLQKAGGLFTLTADVDFGSSFGVLSKYFTSRTTNSAQSGAFRLADADSIAWRNHANGADVLLAKNASDQLTFGGAVIASASGVPASSITGQVAPANGGTGLDTSASTGVPSVSSGTWSVAARLSSALGGTGINTSASTGVPTISSGTWSVAAQLPTSLGGLGGNFGSSTGALSISSGTVSAGTLSIGNGGTGQTAKTAAFDALSPTTTKGDLIIHNGTNNVRQAIGSDGQVAVADSTQTTGFKWATLNQGAKNYVTYNNFENNSTTGWSLQHSTLSSNFPNQTSGSWTSASGNLSIATVSSGQLAGSFSLSYASSAATTAGDMLVSQAYTIDTEDQAKVLTFKFYYQAQTNPANGNYSGSSSNSFGIGIYDVTNGAWIMPAGVWGMTQNSGVGYCTGTFQTPSNMTQFRFAIFNANATSGATTLYFDDFYVGPQTAPFGPALTDWNSSQAWTPTGSWSTNTTYTGYWRRVGGDAEFKVKIALSGAPTSATLTVNLPSGMTFDTARMPGTTTGAVTTMDGEGSGKCAGAATKFNVTYSSTTAVQVNYQSSTAGANSAVTQAAPNTFANGDEIDLYFRGPITGWASNCQMSNDTDTRVCSLVMAPNAAATGTLGAAFNAVVFPSSNVIKDTHGAYNSTTGVFTAPVTGYYAVSATLDITHASIAVGNRVIAAIFYNSTQYAAASLSAGSTAVLEYCPCVSGMVYCNAGDTITIKSNTNGTTPAWTNGQTGSVFNVQRVSGPSVIAATETVACRYTNTAGTTLTKSAANTVPFATKDYDTHGAFVTDTFTAPVSGKYSVKSIVNIATGATWASGDFVYMEVQKNGSTHTGGNVTLFFGTFVGAIGAQIAATVNCNAGDTIKISVNPTKAAASNVTLNTTAGLNAVAIERIGN